MQDIYIEEQTFSKKDYKDTPLEKGEYENCRFLHCDFSDSSLADCKFSDCEFLGCNLSLTKFSNTSFRGIAFKDCKMLGVHFDECNEFGFSVSFDNCILNHSSFFQVKLKKTRFKNTQLKEV